MTSRLDEIRERAERVPLPPGPWTFEVSLHGPATVYDGIDVGWLCRVKESLPLKAEVAEFIAHAREDVPLLLAHVERLTDALRIVSGECEDCQGSGIVADVVNRGGAAEFDWEPIYESRECGCRQEARDALAALDPPRDTQ